MMGTRSVGSVDVPMELICVHSNERFHILRGGGVFQVATY